MPLEPVAIPKTLRELSHSPTAERAIDTANEQIERFMLADEHFFSNFVTCDFHLVDLALTWIHQNHLLAGNRCCEFGSGFGVVTMLAALQGMDSVGIEIEPVLVAESRAVAEQLNIKTQFFSGSFVPRDMPGIEELSTEVENVDTREDDVYDQMGIEIDEFDLFFAYPWPGENFFFESVFEHGAAVGAMLLTYNGREGVKLLRKVA
jgi:hypothetical protein